MEIILNKGEEPNCFDWEVFKRDDIPNTVLNYIVNFTNNWNPGNSSGVQKIIFSNEDFQSNFFCLSFYFIRDFGTINIKNTLRGNDKFSVYGQRANVYAYDLVYTIQYRLK